MRCLSHMACHNIGGCFIPNRELTVSYHGNQMCNIKVLWINVDLPPPHPLPLPDPTPQPLHCGLIVIFVFIYIF